MQIIKRDGTSVAFDSSKIVNAICKAQTEVGELDTAVAAKVANLIGQHGEDGLSVEEIQDAVEEQLMLYQPKVAKAYVLYRDKRAKERNEGWKMSDLQHDIWNNKYRFDNESWDGWLERVSGGNPRIKKLIRKKKFLFGGRILAGRGLHKHGIKVTYSNCYVLTPPHDSIEGIWDTARDMARTYSFGGGVGISLRNLRPRKSVVHNAARTTSGAVSFMDLYSLTTGLIGQEGRRGALMLSIPSSHPDLEEFIDVKRDLTKVTKANISVEWSDEFMLAVVDKKPYTLKFTVEDTGEVIEKEVDAHRLFTRAAENNWAMAEPGCLFWNRIMEYHLMSADPTFEYSGVNPCLHGDSLIQTTDGLVPIKDLVGKTPDVYCMGEDGRLAIRTASKVWMTKQNAKVVKVTTGKGELLCTPDHRIFTTNRGWVEAKDLVSGDKVKGLNRQTTGHKYCSVALSGTDYEKEHRFVMRHYTNIDDMDVHHKDDNGFNNNRSNLEILPHGTHSVVTNTGRKIEVERDELGRYVEKEEKSQRKTKNLGKQVGNNWYVQSVEELEELFDVYDMTVPGVHNFVANNMIVHNCAEEPLPAGGSCLLGSINLSEFVIAPFTEQARFDFPAFIEAVHIAVEGLNEVLDEGLELHPLEEQRKTVGELRQIGLGVMGIHDMLIKLGIVYGSTKSMMLCEMLAHLMLVEAVRESARIAGEKGSFGRYDYDTLNNSWFFQSLIPTDVKEYVKENGLRNSQLLCIAPTGSISTMLGISGGIEPIFALGFNRTTETLHAEKTTYWVDTEIVKEWKEATGNTEVSELFVTSHSLDWHNRIEMQAVWQKYIDASISSTINLHHDTPVDEVVDLYIYAWKMGLKGCTIYRDGCERGGILTLGDESDTGQTDGRTTENVPPTAIETPSDGSPVTGYFSTCPECSTPTVFSGGCVTCPSCGFSPCA